MTFFFHSSPLEEFLSVFAAAEASEAVLLLAVGGLLRAPLLDDWPFDPPWVDAHPDANLLRHVDAVLRRRQLGNQLRDLLADALGHQLTGLLGIVVHNLVN